RAPPTPRPPADPSPAAPGTESGPAPKPIGAGPLSVPVPPLPPLIGGDGDGLDAAGVAKRSGGPATSGSSREGRGGGQTATRSGTETGSGTAPLTIRSVHIRQTLASASFSVISARAAPRTASNRPSATMPWIASAIAAVSSCSQRCE